MADWSETVNKYLNEQVEISSDTDYLIAIGKMSELQSLYKRKTSCFESLMKEVHTSFSKFFYPQLTEKNCKIDAETKHRDVELILHEIELVVNDVQNVHLMIEKQKKVIKKYKGGIK